MRDNMITEMQDNDLHHRLQQDLMEERWETWFAEHEVDEEENMDDVLVD
jgi:hypothetical protein